jgi:hypothetical protein
MLQQKISNSAIITPQIIYELGIETTKIIINKQQQLQNITWTDGESNLDTEYSNLACISCEEAWNKIKINYLDFAEIDIKCITSDINITFTYPDKKTTKHKIELKSSKSKKMLGSTIKKLDINQTLIYCLRPSYKSKTYKLQCSQYHYAMYESDIDLFQDRTPRPLINFEKMNEIDNTLPFTIIDRDSWIDHYAKCGLNRIKENTICQKSWQDDMIKIMKKNIIKEYIMNTLEEQFRIDKISLQNESIN